ncbi:MAG: TIR domain-containing protein [Xanthobacteraceae bacterium]
MTTRVFISHSSKDNKFARAICAALESRGLPCWISSRDVGPGENFMDAIVHAIGAAKVMVLVFSENANNSDDIKREIVLASSAKVTIIPVRVEDVLPKGAFAYQMATRQWIDLFEDWEAQIERLAKWIAATAPSTFAIRTGVEPQNSIADSPPINLDGSPQDKAQRHAGEEAQRKKDEAEAERIAEENRRQQVEAQRIAEENRQKQADAERLAHEEKSHRQAEAEARQRDDEERGRIEAEAARRAEEEQRRTEPVAASRAKRWPIVVGGAALAIGVLIFVLVRSSSYAPTPAPTATATPSAAPASTYTQAPPSTDAQSPATTFNQTTATAQSCFNHTDAGEIQKCMNDFMKGPPFAIPAPVLPQAPTGPIEVASSSVNDRTIRVFAVGSGAPNAGISQINDEAQVTVGNRTIVIRPDGRVTLDGKTTAYGHFKELDVMIGHGDKIDIKVSH